MVKSAVHEVASGEIELRIDHGILLRVMTKNHDPAELGTHEARELAELLVRLADQSESNEAHLPLGKID